MLSPEIITQDTYNRGLFEPLRVAYRIPDRHGILHLVLVIVDQLLIKSALKDKMYALRPYPPPNIGRIHSG